MVVLERFVGSAFPWIERYARRKPHRTVVVPAKHERVRARRVEAAFSEAAAVSLLWLLLLVTGSRLVVNLALARFSYADALFETASAQSNVGLSTDIVDPTMDARLEGMLVLAMWVGQLESISVLTLVWSVLDGLNPSELFTSVRSGPSRVGSRRLSVAAGVRYRPRVLGRWCRDRRRDSD